MTWFSGSELPEASSVTLSPSSTVWSSPASAVGAEFMLSSTVTSTVSVELSPPESVTVSEKVSVVSAVTVGEVKVGICAAASLSVTVGPAVWLHE